MTEARGEMQPTPEGALHDGERDLACAVIMQALADLLGRPYNVAADDGDVRGQAKQFLTDVAGDFARARDAWCDSAGLNPDCLRDRALRLSALVESGDFARARSWSIASIMRQAQSAPIDPADQGRRERDRVRHAARRASELLTRRSASPPP